MIVFGSRGSELALTQTRLVAAQLRERTGEEYRIEVVETKGDRVLDQPLPSIGGKGLFTAELEAALRERRIDAAVHSMKDLPVADPDGLTVGAVTPRVDPVDVLIYDPRFEDLAQPVVPLRLGCKVGTSSHRRRAALCGARPDLIFADVRGNVPTRADKVRRGDYAGIVLAAAGLDRLQLDLRGLRRAALPTELCTPAPAQGALAVQCRADDARLRSLLACLHDAATARCVGAERELLLRLGGGCSMPLGALATATAGGFRLQATLFANPEQHAVPGEAVSLDLRGAELESLVASAAEQLRPLVGDPLAGRSVVLLRPDGEGGELAAALAVAGARVETVALTHVVLLELVADLRELVRDRALCFTSARAVERFCAAAAGLPMNGTPMFAGGPATAAALRAHGHACTSPDEGANGEALARCVIAAGAPPRGVLFPCAEQRHGAFEALLRAAGIDVAPMPVYRIEPRPEVHVPEPAGSVLVFTSPSAVRAYTAAPRAGTARRLAIGPTTAAAMRQLGVRCDATAPSPTAADLIHTILESRP